MCFTCVKANVESGAATSCVSFQIHILTSFFISRLSVSKLDQLATIFADRSSDLLQLICLVLLEQALCALPIVD